ELIALIGAIRRRVEEADQERQAEGDRRRADLAASAAHAGAHRAAQRHERLDEEHDDGEHQRYLEALFILPLQGARDLAPLHRRDVIAEDLVEAEARS